MAGTKIRLQVGEFLLSPILEFKFFGKFCNSLFGWAISSFKSPFYIENCGGFEQKALLAKRARPGL